MWFIYNLCIQYKFSFFVCLFFRERITEMAIQLLSNIINTLQNSNNNNINDNDTKINDTNTDDNTNLERHFDGTTSVNDIGSGDSYYIPNFLSKQTSNECYINLFNELKWWSHFQNFNGKLEPTNRLGNIQYSVTDGDSNIVPWYRYPINNQESLPMHAGYTTSVEKVRFLVEQAVSHKINHVIATLYRNGNDGIGFHSDKMIDIKDNTYIVTISLGNKRRFEFESFKDKRRKDILHLNHGSMLVIGPQTNLLYKHSVPELKSDDNNFNDPRISLSMRFVDSYWNKNTHSIIGKGSLYQDINYPLSPFNIHDLKNKSFKLINVDQYNYTNNKIDLDTYGTYDVNEDNKYVELNEIVNCVYTIHDSHFHGMLFKINDINDCNKIFNKIKSKYPNCAHAPYCGILNNKIMNSDDDEWDKCDISIKLKDILLNYEMNNGYMIVVIRHWFGIFLGYNNLIQSYSICAHKMCQYYKNKTIIKNKCVLYNYDTNSKDVTLIN